MCPGCRPLGFSSAEPRVPVRHIYVSGLPEVNQERGEIDTRSGSPRFPESIVANATLLRQGESRPAERKRERKNRPPFFDIHTKQRAVRMPTSRRRWLGARFPHPSLLDQSGTDREMPGRRGGRPAVAVITKAGAPTSSQHPINHGRHPEPLVGHRSILPTGRIHRRSSPGVLPNPGARRRSAVPAG